MNHVNVETLGKIILLQSTLHVMPDEQSTADFVCRGLGDLPGIDSLSLLLKGTFHARSAPMKPTLEEQRNLFNRLRQNTGFHASASTDPVAEFRDKHAVECLRIETNLELYGLLFAELSNRDIFQEYRPYIENTLNLAALIMENNDQNKLLMDSKAHLEALVKDRTSELESTVNRLREEIRERKKVENKLAESEERLQLALDSVRDAVWDWHVDEDKVYFSSRWYTMLGYEPYEFPEKFDTWRSLVHPEDLPRAEEVVFDHLISGEPFEAEFRMQTKNGQWKWILARGRTVKKDDSGNPARMLGTHVDITERKNSEEALQSSHQTFLKVLNSIDASIYVADMETHQILFMNKHMINSFKRDMTGEICWEVFRGRTGPCSHCTNSQLVDEGGNPTGLTVWQGKNPITGRWYINHDRAIEWIDGRIVRIQIATDITQHIKMEEQLRQAQKMESVGRLAGGVAHDFNNMLGVILGNAEITLEDMDPESPLTYNLTEIQKAAEHSADITRQLLAFSRKQTVAPKVLDLNQTIESMLKMLKRLIGEDINLTFNPGTSLWPLKIDPAQVNQILTNLCINARDAIDNVGKVIIETGNISADNAFCRDQMECGPGDYVTMSVTDNGKGMDEDTVENLFEPFFTTKDVGRGTGLGLATVYGIVKQNNGFINVYSTPGQGTTFRIYLPRHFKKPAESETGNSKEPTESGSEVILLVEDETAILKMTQTMLQRMGYSVIPAAGPEEALRKGQNHSGKIQLLITDVIMPDMNGPELAKKLTELYPDLKCLFMSGYTKSAIANRQGVIDDSISFLHKPFGKHELATRVRTILDHVETIG